MNHLTPAAVDPLGPIAREKELALSGLLDPATMQQVLTGASSRSKAAITACRIGHIRYEPGSSFIISYSVDYTLGDRPGSFRARLYARACDKADYIRRARSLHEKSWIPGALLSDPVVLAEHQAIAYEFPNDARLPHLATFAQPATIMKIMQRIAAGAFPGHVVSQHRLELRLLRYKPESRCVLYCAVECDPRGDAPGGPLAVVLRTAKGGRVEATHRVLSQLYRCLPPDAPLGVPHPLFCDPRLQLSAVEWIEGEKLSDLWTSPGGNELVRKTGRALAWLHQAGAPESLEMKHSGRESRIERALLLLETSTPAVASHVESMREQFRQDAAPARPGRTGWIHGDFHQGQVLCRGGSVWFLDFDSSAAGEIEQDLGNFKAQLLWLKLQGRLDLVEAIALSLLEGYREAARVTPDEQRIRFWCAAGLTELAAKQYRRLKADWPRTVPLLLAAARAELWEH